MKGSTTPLLILGTGLWVNEVVELVSENDEYKLAGFVENMEHEKCKQKIQGLPIYWVDDVASMAHTHQAICSLGTTHRKRFTDQIDALGMSFAKLVHSTATISPKTELDEGVIVCAGVLIASQSRLGKHVRVNRGTLIGHHTHISDFVTIQPGANIAGLCHIGEATYVGMGAVILDHIKIGSHSIIGAGSVVTKDVPDNVQVVGVPAKIVKENIEGL